ncbi:MAG: DPP IV N-terminal domain-containing protein [Mariniblastus sp.]
MNSLKRTAFFFAIVLTTLSALPVFGQSRSGKSNPINWSSDGSQLWFTRKQGNQKQFIVVDVKTRSKSPAFDHQAVAKSLSQQLEKEIAADDLPINQLFFGDSENDWFLQVGKQYFSLDSKTSKLNVIERPSKISKQPRLFRPARQGYNGEATDLVIENQTDKTIALFWLDPRNREVDYGSVKPNEKWQQNTYAGHVWVIKVDGKLKGCYETKSNDHLVIDDEILENVKRESSRRPRRSTRRSRGNFSDRVSPDRKWDATVRDHDLWLKANKADGSKATESKGTRLTDYGTKLRTFQRIGSGTRWSKPSDDSDRGDFHWSPDSKHLVAYQTKRVDEPRVHYVESTPKDGLQPKLRSYQYPKPGDELLVQTLHLFSVNSGKEIPVSDELFANPFWTRFLGWSESGESFRLLYNQRGHQVMRLLEVTAATGKVKTIIEEKSDTFIQYSDRGKSVFEELTNEEILWASERSGWNHLYRFNRKTGDLINAVTKGDWNVKRILEIDREKKLIQFVAVGVHEDQDPYHEHLCSVNFDGTNFRILTDGDGTHSVEFIQDQKYFIDTYSRVDMAAVKELRETKTGDLIVELGRQDTKRLFGNRRLTERFVAKGRDGKTDIWGIIHWPRDFDPNKKYPVVENIYAGPHDHHVPKSFRARYGHQLRIADAGMIVVQIDGMGTAWRSKAFHDVCFKNLRDAGFPDRIAWMKAAAETFPQMDITRVGIYGGSAGGQNAMAALLWHNDFYKVAVADCGCHDNRMDKIWWNEQWMGWPVDKSYVENSNKENANLLKGNLMLTVGELDQNVDPATTTQVIHELIKHDKDFEFVLIAGKGHGAGESPWAAKKRLNFLKRHLKVDGQ